MARGRKRKVETPSISAASLVAALKFVNVAQKSIGESYVTHCALYQHWAYAFNGVLSAGHKIADDLNACPHTERLIDALGKAGDSLSLAQLDSGRLSVTSGKFRAFIPCIEFGAMPHIYPDPMIAPMDDRVMKALSIVADFATEGAQTILASSVLLRPNSAIATDRKVLVEAWHGIDLPPGLVLPKASVAAILSAGKKIKGFGCSFDEQGKTNSATFHFEDDSWIKTQLYREEWPDCDRILNQRTANPWPIPKGLPEAMQLISSFSEDGGVYCIGGKLCSHPNESIGASVEVVGLPKDRSLSVVYYSDIFKIAQTIDFGPEPSSVVLFFGENVRGAMGGRAFPEAAAAEDPAGIDYAAVQEAAAGVPGAYVPAASPQPLAQPSAQPSAISGTATGTYAIASNVRPSEQQ